MPDHAILTADAHRDLRVRPGRSAAAGDAVMCAIVVPDEFRQVQNEYPILFRRNLEHDSFAAFAMFGFENGENLFLDGDRWAARTLPLSVAIQPFLVGRPEGAESATRQVHIDLASPRLGNEGVRLFEEDGQPTPYLETVIEKLGALDAGYQASADFFAALRRYELLEPFALEVPLVDGSVHRMIGFHVIDEARLRALDQVALADLHQAGHLMPIFMALASLANIGALVARKNQRLRHG
ncbi:SapC family protein [Sphingomonas sp. PL-96]|uniref:SapC family protein n=1 Tax=Sphingomonas sp. PL-96 TaxID=2887201 RepID=UPI001E432A78|nr:SapC family protein [Sphingomonas sp. PL-96]MCC2977439.1 SapC family protein [Sphingomonas sp. PL-96]